MKKLIALLAVLSFVPYANAADGADFSHSGSFRLQYKNYMQADGNKDAGASTDQVWHQRLRWATDVRAGEKLSGHFMLVHNADWGSNSDQTPDDIAETANVNATNNVVLVNEAYATWAASDAWMFRFGRGSFTMADGRFVSANEYEYVQNAFDGAMATWDQEMARLSFFGVEGADYGSTDGLQNKMATFFGVAADFKSLPDFLKAAHLHVVQVKRDPLTAAVPKQSNMRVGFMASGDTAGVDYRLNYEMEDGENDATMDGGAKTDISTSMIDAEVGYAVPSMMNARFHVGYHMDSGTKSGADDETYDGFYYDKHYNAGLMDIFGWGNLTYMRVGFSLEPADDITVGAEYLMFSKTEKEDAANAFAAAFASAGGTEDELGDELDFSVTKKYTNNFNINARYSMFMPGKAYTNDDTYSQFFVTANLTF